MNALKTPQTYKFYDFLCVNCDIGIYRTKPFQNGIISVNEWNSAIFDIVAAVVIDIRQRPRT